MYFLVHAWIILLWKEIPGEQADVVADRKDPSRGLADARGSERRVHRLQGWNGQCHAGTAQKLSSIHHLTYA